MVYLPHAPDFRSRSINFRKIFFFKFKMVKIDIEKIFSLYEAHGEKDYVGEPVSQLGKGKTMITMILNLEKNFI